MRKPAEVPRNTARPGRRRALAGAGHVRMSLPLA